MSHYHGEKYIAKLLVGFSLIIVNVMLTFYMIFERPDITDWYFWAAISAILLCLALYLISSAFVHKIKSDFLKRQRSRSLSDDKS